MTRESFIGKCLAEMVADDVSVRFNKRIYDSRHSYNSFTPDPRPELAINFFSQNIDEWFPIFVHEYCHYLQWSKTPEIWKKYDKPSEHLHQLLYEDRPTISKKYLHLLQEVELNCDKMAIELIKKHKLKVNLKDYIVDSNLYIACYPLIAKYKKMVVPYEGDAYDIMPKEHFTLDDLVKKNYDHKALEKIFLTRLD